MLLDVVSLAFFSSFFENALKGDGADFDMGGNAALLDVDEGFDDKGFFGAAEARHGRECSTA